MKETNTFKWNKIIREMERMRKMNVCAKIQVVTGIYY